MLDLVWTAPLPQSDSSAELLDCFESAQARISVEEARQVEAAARYAALHTTDSELDEFAVVEFAAVTGMGSEAGRMFLLGASELVARLPRVWPRVQSGEVAGWRGRRIAETTLDLPEAAATWVDAEVVGRAEKVGVAKLDQLTAEALARFDPETAAAQAEAALDTRRVRIHPTGPVAYLEAVLDTADAADLEAALSTIATGLDATEPLDVRRARALGMLARGDADISLAREVVLHVHLTDADTIAEVRSHTGRPLGLTTITQISDWCASAAKVTVKPVIDLAETLTSSGYSPSARVRDHVTEVCETCVFPWCHRPAERLDLDHISPYDPGGPPGQTNTANLAALCRRHHRAKTFTAWAYDQIASGEFLWTSPYGWQFLRTRDGTTNLGRQARRHAA